MLINLLQRYHLWIFIALSALSGLALANLTATGIGMLVDQGAAQKFTPAAPAHTIVSRLNLRNYQPILKRDIFNADGGDQSFDRRQQVGTAIQEAPTKAFSKWALIGTISGGFVPLATLHADGETSVFKLNEKLPDGGTLATIERNRVEIHYPDGRVSALEIKQDLPTSANTRTTKTKKTTGNSSRIEALGENRWQIPALVAEDARSNIGNLLKQAQAIPYLEGGKTTGFQMRMIRPGSLIAQLGLQRGDILREINGVALNSPEKALQVFGQLRQARQISIGLERRGKAMTFAYEIR